MLHHFNSGANIKTKSIVANNKEELIFEILFSNAFKVNN